MEDKLNKSTPADQFGSLTDEIVKMIQSMDDGEILLESDKQGVSLLTSGNIYDSIADSASIMASKIQFDRLRATKMQQRKRSKPLGKIPDNLNGDLARSIIQHIFEDKSLQLTWSAQNRKVADLTNSEAIQFVKDLVFELGYQVPKKFFNQS